MSIQLKNNSFVTGKLTVGGSTDSLYQLGVDGSIATTSTIAWGMATLGGSPGYAMGVNATSGYLKIDEVTAGGTLEIATDNTRIGSGQVYLEGGLTSAVPSEYLGRVTGGGSGVMVGRTAAQVLSDIGAAPATGGDYLPLTGGTLTGDLTISKADTPKIMLIDTTNDLQARFRVANTYAYLSVDNPNTVAGSRLVFQVDGDEALHLDGSQNATFAGDVIVNGGNLGVGMTPTEVLDIKTTSGDCRMRLDAPSGSDTEIKFFNAGAAQYTIGHDDASDEFRIATTNVEDPMLSFTKTKNATFAGTGTFETTLNVIATDGGGSPAMTAVMNMHGYDQRGVGIKMKDNKTTSGGSTDAEWFVGTGYNSTGFNIGYASDGSQSSYPAQAKLAITTSGNASVAGNITLGSAQYGQLNLQDSGTSYGNLYKYGGGFWIQGAGSGNTINFGAPTAFVQNVRVNGLVNLNNLQVNSAQGTSGQVLTSSGSGVSWQNPATSGTVTGSGAAGRVAFWDSSSNITGIAGFTFNTTGDILYVNGQVQVKGVGPADYTVNGDTDTGLGSFDGANGVSLVSKGKKEITVKEGAIKFDQYTSTSVATTGSLNANQNNQAPSQDTLATLAVDPSGNVVRGEQEGTWTFTRAQLNATLGNTLIAAPGANKAIIVTESDWMVKYNATGSMSGTQTYDVRQASNTNASAIISTLPGTRINEILSASQGTPVNPSYGFCARDVPLQTRTYKTNTATTLHKASNGALPTGVISISIKLKYRIFDATTF